MSISRQAIRSLRTLHTTSRISSDAPAKALGFGDYTGRTRSLPTIDIPASSRRDVGSKKNIIKLDTNSNTPRPPRTNNTRGVGGRKFPEDKNRRQSKSPLKPAQSTSTEGGDDFFTMTADSSSSSKPKGKKDNKKGMNVVDIDIDFKPEQITANSRSKRNTRTASSSRKPQVEGRGQKGQGRSTGSEPAKRVDDRSTEGIFGRSSLLFPARMGARQAEQSIWAEGMKSEDARKAELERLIGKPTAYLPTLSFPTNLARDTKKVGTVSKELANWIMATNPGISKRREKTGQAVFNTYLK